MTRYFSDHFSGVNAVTLAADNSVLDQNKIPDAGIHRARLRYKRAEITQDLEAGDVVRMMQFKTGDRIVDLFFTHKDPGAEGIVDIGFYKTGRDHDGLVVDADRLHAAHDLGAETGSFRHYWAAWLFRGVTLWEHDGQSSDPMEDWDLAITCVEATTNAPQLILEAYFTSGD